MDLAATNDVLVFNGWRFDRRVRQLFHHDDGGAWLPVSVGSRALAVLNVLVDRPGALVSKDAIMGAVWPRYVEPNNLTVQITILRRVLDQGCTKSSCIQTVPRQGYRFVVMTTKGEQDEDVNISFIRSTDEDQASGGVISGLPIGTKAPRLSLVVLPFQNLSGDSDDDRLAAVVTEDLKTDLCYLDGALVIAYNAAAFRAKPVDIRLIGKQLGVRYIIEASICRSGEMWRVNVRLIATETNTYVWASRFDQDLSDFRLGAEETVSRVRAELVVKMLAVENTRSLQERPNNPDEIDLVLRARSMLRKHDQTESLRNATLLLEEALRLDPASVPIMCDLAGQLINRFMNTGDDQDDENILQQAIDLVTAAAAIELNYHGVIYRRGYLLRALGRWSEAIAFLQRVVELLPRFNHGFRQLGFCKLAVCQTEEAISLLRRSIYLDPLAPENRWAYWRMGQAHLFLGCDAAAIDCAQRALAQGSMGRSRDSAACYLLMASAHALAGQLEDARHALAEANRLNPFETVHSFLSILSHRGLPGPAYMAQVCRMKQGLRLAGLREHAEEGADFGAMSDGMLRREQIGLTPSSACGATTISTSELVDFISKRNPILLDVGFLSHGQSLPRAIGLQGLGHGATFSDTIQTRFRRKIHDLTEGDLLAPIVAYCANAERFTGYNLVLRLVALGYRQVYWYRGGWEAWQVAGRLMTTLDLQNW
ncbi:winged helix-turn-helix domain-containing protein [Rhodopila sp.]|uniref:winged helix-turn-helix domain-containing protein n=1 Tax=Rhodopila sp. TaxID=2480087 RepID=UPI003D11C817